MAKIERFEETKLSGLSREAMTYFVWFHFCRNRTKSLRITGSGLDMGQNRILPAVSLAGLPIFS